MIAVKNISKSFENRVVLRDINIELDYGNCYAVVGRNGVGKTTLFKIILDLIKPNSGEVLFSNKTYKTDGENIKQSIGCILGEELLIQELTGMQYLKLVGKLRKIPKITLDAEIKHLTEFFFSDISNLSRSIEHYSSGMKQSLSTCASLLHHPNILILDEPFSNLDVVQTYKLIEFLKQYQNMDRVIIFSSHNLDYASKIANKIIVLKDGKIEYFGNFPKTTNDEGLTKLITEII